MIALRERTVAAGFGGVCSGLALAGLVTEHCGEPGLWAGTTWGPLVDGAFMLLGFVIIWASGKRRC